MTILGTEIGKPILTKGANTPLTIDGTAIPILEKSEEGISPIAYCKFYTGSETITLPIYKPEDVKASNLRIWTGSLVGAFDLLSLTDSASSAIRVQMRSGRPLCVKKI